MSSKRKQKSFPATGDYVSPGYSTTSAEFTKTELPATTLDYTKNEYMAPKDQSSSWNKEGITLGKDFSKDLSLDKQSDLYTPAPSTVLPPAFTEQEKWAQSQHIMEARKHEQAARMAACVGSKHLSGQPIGEAKGAVEHKCDTGCELDCVQPTNLTIISTTVSSNTSGITEEEVLLIRKHDQVAEQAAAAGARIMAGGWFSKQVHVKDATAAVNQKFTTGPSFTDKISDKAAAAGSSISGAASTLSEKASSAASTVSGAMMSAKDTIISTKEEVVEAMNNKGQVSETQTQPTRIQKVISTANTVKETLVDVGNKAAPYVAQAAQVAGQVIKGAVKLAQPVVHQAAAALADATSKPLVTDTNTSTTTETKETTETELNTTETDTLPESSSTTSSTLTSEKPDASTWDKSSSFSKSSSDLKSDTAPAMPASAPPALPAPAETPLLEQKAATPFSSSSSSSTFSTSSQSGLDNSFKGFDKPVATAVLPDAPKQLSTGATTIPIQVSTSQPLTTFQIDVKVKPIDSAPTNLP